jgi:hypothetical protein
MNYSNKSHINTVTDIKAFFHHLVDERKVDQRAIISSSVSMMRRPLAASTFTAS